jgi:integrase
MAKKTLRQQATAVIRSKTAFNIDNKKGGNASTKTVPGNYKSLQSIRSMNETVLALAKIAEDMNVQRIKQITEVNAAQYLELKRDNFASQKALDRDRKALSIALGIEIPRLSAISEQILSSRAYSKEQINNITKSMTERNALAVKVAHNAGLRAHELLTLKRVNEGTKTISRTWTEDRFAGREGTVYLVTGKGGLTREVLISNDLVRELEDRRYEQPQTKVDRGINYLQRYDIGGGNALSSSFTRASQRSLTFSNGLHGIRHRYAQERIDEIKLKFNVDHDSARDIVAQELGHFRGDITEVYLR